MIEINFPPNPENYIYELKPKFASVYLLARAIQHYGADNVNVICTHFKNEQDYRDRQSVVNNIERTAEMLGIKHLRYIWLENVAPNFPRNINGDIDALAIDATIAPIIQLIDPLTKSVHQDGEGYKYNKQVLSKIIAMAIISGVVNPDLTVNTTQPYKTMVRWEAMDGWEAIGNKPSYRNVVLRHRDGHDARWKDTFAEYQPEGLLWFPLLDYGIQDILEATKEEGLTDVVLSATSCIHNRPLHCGACHGCVIRRIILLDAGITDTTKYELA